MVAEALGGLRDHPAAAATATARTGARAVDVGRPLVQRDADGLLGVAAVERDVDLVARLVGGDRVRDRVLVLHVLAVDRDDHVGAGSDALRGAGAAAPETRLGGRAAGSDLDDQRAVIDRKIEVVGELRVHALHLNAEVGALDRLAGLELRELVLDRVDRDGEADAHGSLTAAGLDLRVDADHAPVGVEQRTARVAGVDRRVRLDDVRDREAVRRLDLALEAGDDARGDRAAEPERVADRDHGVAHLRLGRVPEGNRREVLDLRRVDLEDGDVRGPVDALDVGVDRLAVLGEADGHVVRALDNVRVRDDVAVLVDHEAGPGGRALLGKPEW